MMAFNKIIKPKTNASKGGGVPDFLWGVNTFFLWSVKF